MWAVVLKLNKTTYVWFKDKKLICCTHHKFILWFSHSAGESYIIKSILLENVTNVKNLLHFLQRFCFYVSVEQEQNREKGRKLERLDLMCWGCAGRDQGSVLQCGGLSELNTLLSIVTASQHWESVVVKGKRWVKNKADIYVSVYSRALWKSVLLETWRPVYSI